MKIYPCSLCRGFHWGGMCERGIALPMAMIVMVLLTTLMMSFMAMSANERDISENHKLSHQAYYVAESGIEGAKRLMASANLAALYGAGCPGTLWSGDLEYGHVTVTVTNLDGGCSVAAATGVYVVTSRGTVEVDRARAAVVAQLMTPNPFAVGVIWGRDSVTISGGAKITGPVSSNGQVTVSGSTTQVTGKVTSNDSLQFKQMDCPASYTPVFSGSKGVTYEDGSTTKKTKLAAGTLLVASGANLTLSPGTYYFSDLVLAGNGSLTTQGKVTIIVGDTLNTSGGYIVNASNAAANLTIQECGASASQWFVTGGSSAEFGIYAPTHPVALSGQASIRSGAIVAASIDDSGGVGITYDPAMAQTQWGTAPFTLVKGTFHNVGG